MSDYINKALLDASPYKKQASEAKKLVNKWDKTGLLDGLNEDFKRSGMAMMLENQAKQLISEASFTGGGARGSAAGATSEEWSGVALPLVRRIFGEIAAQEFVSVQVRVFDPPEQAVHSEQSHKGVHVIAAPVMNSFTAEFSIPETVNSLVVMLQVYFPEVFGQLSKCSAVPLHEEVI